ncbi:uncharacterized protein LOC135384278 [Ornithodoros turicata]|uniref:uncharacterized protein LOC135384278 n=1 Tax=Ornithodoros turicata TaxID=34597 RepID=UPI0031392990
MHEEELLLLKKKMKLMQRRKMWWVRPLWLNRKHESEYHTGMAVMRQSGDVTYFVEYFRMTPDKFDYLHSLVGEELEKQHLCREPISPAERLARPLRYFSSGMAIKDVALGFRVGIQTAREAVHLTRSVLWNTLKVLYMKPPTEAGWKAIAKEFLKRWCFPNCAGAVDGKHVKITCPKKSGSRFYNCKGTFSIVLMAVVDSQYKCLLIDVGAEDRQSDSGVLKASAIGHHLEAGTLGLNGMSLLPGTSSAAPHVLIGDEAFQLRTDLMRPYSARELRNEKRVFNFMLSSARNFAENALGIVVKASCVVTTQLPPGALPTSRQLWG